MNTIATAAKTTVVRIGKGLTFHAQAKGVDTAAAACGTVGKLSSSAANTIGTVTCRKCLDTIHADAALEAQQVREAEMAAEAATPASTDAMNAKAARLASLKDRLEAATSRRAARGETIANKTEMRLAEKIAGVEAWVAAH